MSDIQTNRGGVDAFPLPARGDTVAPAVQAAVATDARFYNDGRYRPPLLSREDIEASDLPHYRLTEKSYIHGVMHPPGAIVTTPDDPGKHMIPLNDAARDRYEAVREHIERGPQVMLPDADDAAIKRLAEQVTRLTEAVAQLAAFHNRAPVETEDPAKVAKKP